jgi:hypothetical protein
MTSTVQSTRMGGVYTIYSTLNTQAMTCKKQYRGDGGGVILCIMLKVDSIMGYTA